MYLKIDDSIYFDDIYMYQVFKYKTIKSVSNRVIIEYKHNGLITQRDVDIAKFLFDTRFATLEQICRFLVCKGHISLEGKSPEEQIKIKNEIRALLDKLAEYRALNKFMLSNESSEYAVKADSLQIYCLEVGGRYLLANYAPNNLDVNGWYSASNKMSASNISRRLILTNIHVKMLESCGERFKAFKLNPVLTSGFGDEIVNTVPDFIVTIEKDGIDTQYVCQIVKDYDLPYQFREKVLNFEHLFKRTLHWKKYFDAAKPPVIFIFAEDDKLMEGAAEELNNVGIENYRLTTDARAQKDLSILYKYNQFDKRLEATANKIFKK